MIDETLFLHNLYNTDIPILGQNTDDAIKHVTEVLYQDAKSSKRKALTRNMNSTLGRWERLGK